MIRELAVSTGGIKTDVDNLPDVIGNSLIFGVEIVVVLSTEEEILR